MTQRWLVTGSSRGIGRALSEAVLDAGHYLVATARDPDQLGDLAQRCGETARMQRDYDGRQPGDPGQAAQAILRIATMDQPPFRLPLRRDALKIIVQATSGSWENLRHGAN